MKVCRSQYKRANTKETIKRVFSLFPSSSMYVYCFFCFCVVFLFLRYQTYRGARTTKKSGNFWSSYIHIERRAKTKLFDCQKFVFVFFAKNFEFSVLHFLIDLMHYMREIFWSNKSCAITDDTIFLFFSCWRFSLCLWRSTKWNSNNDTI